MLEIDGSEKSGSGTIVRDAVPFCILTGQEIHLRNIRAKKDKPGLRPQHLKVLEAAASLCVGMLDGGTVGSREIWFHPVIDLLSDEKEAPAFESPSVQAGAALAVWLETDTGCLIGADMAGARGRTAEFIGKQTALNLSADLGSGATVDTHLADQVIPFAALAKGMSTFRIPCMTEHIEARLWLAEKILGATYRVRENVVTIEGIGLINKQ